MNEVKPPKKKFRCPDCGRLIDLDANDIAVGCMHTGCSNWTRPLVLIGGDA